MNTADILAEYDNPQVEVKLAQETGMPIKSLDYANWMDPQSKAAVKRFDRAVVKYLGKPLYDEAADAARLDLVLRVKLGLAKKEPKHEITLARRIIKSVS